MLPQIQTVILINIFYYINSYNNAVVDDSWGLFEVSTENNKEIFDSL